MRKIFSLSIMITTVCAFSMIVSAQSENPTAKELFRKYAQAMGGRAAAEKIKSRVIKGTLELKPQGMTGTFETYSKAANKNLAVLNLTGLGEILDGFDGTEAWSKNPLQGLRSKDGEELEEAKVSSDFYYDFNFEKIYPKAVVTGSDKVADADVYVVKADDETTILYFDKQTGFMVRADRTVISPEGKVPTQTYFSDFREVDGVKQAFSFRQVAQGLEFVMQASEVQQNVEIADAKFTKPK